MGQNRLDLPNGAESTCLERPGRVGHQEDFSSRCPAFPDHSQLQRAVKLLNKEVHHRDVMDFFSVRKRLLSNGNILPFDKS